MATIKDIAERAGVTVTTVSRVLNNRGYISEATREKVYQAMKELDYQPNEIARSLVRGKTNILGLILPTVDHPFFSKLTFLSNTMLMLMAIRLCYAIHSLTKRKKRNISKCSGETRLMA